MAADVVGYSRLLKADEAGTLVALKSLRQTVARISRSAPGCSICGQSHDRTREQAAKAATYSTADEPQVLHYKDVGDPPAPTAGVLVQAEAFSTFHFAVCWVPGHANNATSTIRISLSVHAPSQACADMPCTTAA